MILAGCDKIFLEEEGTVVFYITNAASTGNSGIGSMVEINGETKTWFSHRDVLSTMINCDSETNFYTRFVLPNGTYTYTITAGTLGSKTGQVTVKGNCNEVHLSL